MPFALGALAQRAAIVPAADQVATSLSALVMPRVSTTEPAVLRASNGSAYRRKAEALADARVRLEAAAAPVAKDVATGIFVSAAAVSRALELRDVGATSSPLGARLVGVSRYRTGLRDGDVVISVAGTRTPTIAAMVAAALDAASHGASRISGQIMREDVALDVVLELPR